MRLLPTITGPGDLRDLSKDQLNQLAEEIRQFLITSVSATGGHLGPNLGVIELTIALHRVFSSPRDTVLFDTGHQSYVHKLLTGRQDFSRLRCADGLSGYPSRAESVHDVLESSHASSSLSWADGIAKGRELRGEQSRRTVAVIGDGALTGGMAWEAINNIAVSNRRVVIVVNDNERSYAPTVGGMAQHLATLRTTSEYEKMLDWGKTALQRSGPPGRFAYDTLHGVKKGLKDVVAPQGLFEDLGMKYVGPIDGHDLDDLEHALRRAGSFDGPVLVHAITRKGNGYAPAREHEGDQFHSVGVIDPDTGKALSGSGKSWTAAFAEEMVQIGAERPDVVGITAAMLIPVGLHKFAAAYPDRVYDVGIAEQHALASAAGLAFAGLHPVVAIYATFMNRAFDQVLMDVGLHRAGVTMVLDRAGVTGPDGASHHGMWDLAMLSIVPGIAVAAPRDTERMVAELREAVEVSDHPTVLRIAKDDVPEEIPAIDQVGGVDVLHRGETEDVLVVCVGPMAGIGLDVAQRLTQQGIGATVVDPRWVLPVDDGVLTLAGRHRLVVTIEDGLRAGGVGTHVAQAIRDGDIDVPVHNLGLPSRFLSHGSRRELLAEAGLTAQHIGRDIVERMARLPEPVVNSRASTNGRVHEDRRS